MLHPALPGDVLVAALCSWMQRPQTQRPLQVQAQYVALAPALMTLVARFHKWLTVCSGRRRVKPSWRMAMVRNRTVSSGLHASLGNQVLHACLHAQAIDDAEREGEERPPAIFAVKTQRGPQGPPEPRKRPRSSQQDVGTSAKRTIAAQARGSSDGGSAARLVVEEEQPTLHVRPPPLTPEQQEELRARNQARLEQLPLWYIAQLASPSSPCPSQLSVRAATEGLQATSPQHAPTAAAHSALLLDSALPASSVLSTGQGPLDFNVLFSGAKQSLGSHLPAVRALALSLLKATATPTGPARAAA